MNLLSLAKQANHGVRLHACKLALFELTCRPIESMLVLVLAPSDFHVHPSSMYGLCVCQVCQSSASASASASASVSASARAR